MLEQVNPAQQLEPLSAELDLIWVLFNTNIGPARVLIPAGAKVRHIPYYSASRRRYFINVIVNDQLVGLHCGARTHRVIAFSRKSDAERLCEVRNEARRSR